MRAVASVSSSDEECMASLYSSAMDLVTLVTQRTLRVWLGGTVVGAVGDEAYAENSIRSPQSGHAAQSPIDGQSPRRLPTAASHSATVTS